MRFLMIYRPDPSVASAPPSPECMAAMDRHVAENARNGTLLTTGGLKPGRRALRRSGDEVRVLDGPYAEAKEIIGGFAICELPSWEAAEAAARQFLELAGPGTSEIHAMWSPEDFGKEPLPALVENEKRLHAELTGSR